MYRNILLAAALQQWDRYSVHALAARDVAAALTGPGGRLHVLSVYEYEYLSGRIPASGLPAEMAARIREQETEQTDRLMKAKLNEYVAPLMNRGATISPILRVGSPRHLIVEVASEIEADLVVIGSHSKRGILDIALGGTAHHVSMHAPGMVLMVAPKKK
jgi:nucleotide-binding universal stress UspA family protein